MITPANHKLTFLVTGNSGRQHGYEDHWAEDGSSLDSTSLLSQNAGQVSLATLRWGCITSDSLCIVGAKKRSFVPCSGGKFRWEGKPAIKALSLKDVRLIAEQFNRLNPYSLRLVPHLLKVEDVNFVD
jgi:hypothetical protein